MSDLAAGRPVPGAELERPEQEQVQLGRDEGVAIPSSVGLRELVREDWVTHGSEIGSAGMHALVLYRIGRESLHRQDLLWRIVRLVYHKVNRLWIRNVYGAEIPPEATIGRRVHLPNVHGVSIDPDAVIGDDCLIRHNATIGRTSSDPSARAPRIGNRVHMGNGAVVIGEVTVGDDAVIGPNAVVISSVPAGATAYVPPAKLLRGRSPSTG